MDKNLLSPKVPLNGRMCCRVKNQLGKAFELNLGKDCTLININNLEECMANKQMVCKVWKSGSAGQESGSFSSSVHK